MAIKRIYGVPLFLMKKYLADLGGQKMADNRLNGDGWQATLRKAEPVKIGSLVVGRIEVAFSGDEAAIAELLDELHWKTLRGGG